MLSFVLRTLACVLRVFFFLMIRRPPRSTLDRSSAASDVYKRQALQPFEPGPVPQDRTCDLADWCPSRLPPPRAQSRGPFGRGISSFTTSPVSYTHLRAHATVLALVCRLLLEHTRRRDTAGDNYHISHRHRIVSCKYDPVITARVTRKAT